VLIRCLHFVCLSLFDYFFFFNQIARFMNSNLDFISTKTGVRTRGMTTAVDSEVKFAFGFS